MLRNPLHDAHPSIRQETANPGADALPIHIVFVVLCSVVCITDTGLVNWGRASLPFRFGSGCVCGPVWKMPRRQFIMMGAQYAPAAIKKTMAQRKIVESGVRELRAGERGQGW